MRLKRPEDFFIRKLLKEAKISEIMASPVISIQVGEKFSEVEKKFRTRGIRHLPVVDAENKIVGLITQRDLYRIVSPRQLMDGGWYYDKEMLDDIVLGRVMTPNPLTFHPENSVGEALLAMVNRKFGCFPVVDQQNKLCGIITQIDILKIAAQILTEQ